MLYYRIIDCCIVFRLAPASLYKCFLYEVREVDSFERFFLPETVNIILSRFGGRDR
mgnify:CR=1 FL=1|jgi:hypothetical protein